MIRVFRTALFIAWFSISGAAVAFAACAPNKVDLRGDWGQAAFSVELADDAKERGQGLMFREQMPRMTGMLFAYEAPVHATFWMRNTLIPLDMIFANSQGQVTHIHHLAQPLDETVIDGGQDVQFVLEINGGMAQQFGIDVGSEMRHPAISAPNAVWSCK